MATFTVLMPDIDFSLVIQERWWMIAIIAIVLAIYILSMEFRRFLAVVMMPIVFQIMWESISMWGKFPFFSLVYEYRPEIDVYMIWVPWSSILLKSLLYVTGSYLFVSAAGRKYITSKVDLVRDRGKRVGEHMTVALFGSIVHVLACFIIEPLLANGDAWFLGSYESFVGPGYFGVDLLYFIGTGISTAATMAVAGMLDARIGEQRGKERALFDFEGSEQTMLRRHQTGFVVFAASLFIPAFISLLVILPLGLFSFLVFIPSIFMIFWFVSWWGTRMDNGLVSKFCKDNPGSFICRM